MNSAKDVFCSALNIYLLVLLARAILSWFPMRSGGSLSGVQHVLYQLTEPLLAPLRRIIPPAGMFDLSFLVLFIGIEILHSVLVCRGQILF